MSLTEKEIYRLGHFILDPTERVPWCEGMHAPLTPKAFVRYFTWCAITGTKGELLNQVWPDIFV